MRKITLEEYIRNPSGGRILSTFQRDALQQEYNKKFDNLMLKVAGKINYTMFKNHDGSRFILYLAIPSESYIKEGSLIVGLVQFHFLSIESDGHSFRVLYSLHISIHLILLAV